MKRPAPPPPFCPACQSKFYGVGPRQFPRVECACGVVLVWEKTSAENGPVLAIAPPENVHDTAPSSDGKSAALPPPEVPSEYQSHMIPTGQVSRKIESERGAGSSKPSSGAPSNSASLADLAPVTDGPTPQSTTPVPTPRPPLEAGAPLCSACHETRGELVTGRTEARRPGAPCQLCGGVTFLLFTPQVGQGVTVPLAPARRAIDRCTCEHNRDAHVGGAGPCTAYTGQGLLDSACCRCARWLRVPAAAPPPASAGQPFGVEIKPMAEAPDRWQCSVRDAAGEVAYVSIALMTEDAARWAALSWLRGYARDVANEHAEALRTSFQAESLKTDASNGDPAATIAVPAERDARHARDAALWKATHERNDDPVVALFAVRGISESLRDRLLAWLKARERAWELLSEDADAEAFTVALTKDRADCDLAEVFALLGVS
jgi:hypothetical protein